MNNTFARLGVPLSILGLILLLVWVFWPTLVELNQRWMNPEEPYTQSYLVLILAAYLGWMRMNQAPRDAVHPMWIAFAPLLIGTLLWCIGFLSNTQIVAQLVLPVIIWSGVALVFGWALAKRLIAPVMFFYFTIPFWGILGIPLRTMAVAVVSKCLALLNIPAFIEGFRIYLPAGVVEVAGGCSGQNYLIAGMVLGFFYAFSYLRGLFQICCIFLIVMLSIVANWIRILLLVIIGHVSDMRHPLMTEHSNFGWAIFVVMLVIFFVSARWLEIEQKPSVDGRRFIPSTDRSNHNDLVKLFYLVGLFFLALMPAIYSQYAIQQHAESVKGFTLPNEIFAKKVDKPDWLPAYRGYDISQQWNLYHPDTTLTLTALSYINQRQGRELVQGKNKLAAESNLQHVETAADNKGIRISVEIVELSGHQQYLLWTYRVGDWYTISKIWAKIYQAYSNLLDQPQSALLVFSVNCYSYCDKAIDPDYIDSVYKILRKIDWAR